MKAANALSIEKSPSLSASAGFPFQNNFDYGGRRGADKPANRHLSNVTSRIFEGPDASPHAFD
jgi:hypothetical protein